MFLSLFRADDADDGDRSPWSDFFFSPVPLRTSSGVNVSNETAMRHAAVYACVRVLSESMAVLPFRLYRPSQSGRGREEVTDHWLYRLFAKRPNRFQTPFAWREMLQGHLALRGNAYCQIIDNSAGQIEELLPLHPDRVRVEVLANGEIRYRYADAAGNETAFRRDQIWHVRGLSDDGVMGLSPIEVNREAVGGAIAGAQYANRFWSNDASPTSGWIEYPGQFRDAEAQRKFKESVQRAQGGAKRGRMMVLDRGMKYHTVGMTNKDSQFIEARQFSIGEIARIFRIPPHKIGDLSRSTNNNIEHQSLEFWTDTMLPWTERWESSIECDLLGEEEDLEVEFDYRRLLRGDAASRGNYLRAMVLSGILTRNEARDEEGRNPLDGLDEPLVPTNMAAGDDMIAPGTKMPGATDTAAPDMEGDDSADARAVALARAAAERLARKELFEVKRALRSGASDEQLTEVYASHAGFVAAALGVPKAAADAYCVDQAEQLRPDLQETDYMTLAQCRLERLALTGTHFPKG